MRNFWVQRENPFAVWYADVTPLLGAPEELLVLLKRVYEAAAQARLLLPVACDPSGDMSRRWEAERTIDVFRLGRARVEADLAWYSADDVVNEGRVADLGKLLASLEPTPGSIELSNRVPGSPPVDMRGSRISYAGSAPSPRLPYGEKISITLRSDIWFPYVLGHAHPHFDSEHYFDNRELASRHTSRLNELLGTIERLVSEAGGTLTLDRDDMHALYAPWLSDRGVNEDGPQPALMPPAAMNVEWPILDE